MDIAKHEKGMLVILKYIQKNFKRDRLDILNFFGSALTESYAYKNNAVVVWVHGYASLIVKGSENLAALFDSKDTRLLRKHDLSTVYGFIDEYLNSTHYDVQIETLITRVIAFQKTTALQTVDLDLVSICIGVVLQHQINLTLKKSLSGSLANQDQRNLEYAVLSFMNYRKIDWQDFVERTSLVDNILEKDPAGMYLGMDSATKKEYRDVVQDLSTNSSKSEIEIAKRIVYLASGDANNRHVGFFLFRGGRSLVEDDIRCHYTLRRRVSDFFKNNIPVLYVLLLATVVSIVLSVAVFMLLQIGVTLLYVFVLLVPTAFAAEDLANYIIAKFVRPQKLYKMDYSRGIPGGSRTMMVVPTQLGESVDEPSLLIRQLESNYLNDRSPNLYFGLLLAFKDSHSKTDIPSVLELENLELIRQSVLELNGRYANDNEPRFFVFIRSRKWNSYENELIEWERKRGKISEFNQLLRGGMTDFSTEGVDAEFLAIIKYVITVDQGDILPKEAARRLVATIDHPLNRPQIDKTKNVVNGGYGFIQPQMLCKQDSPATLLELAFSGNRGWGSYSGLAANLYQDVFGASLYVGKGIYDVDVFNAVLYKRIPENTMLSHDHVEGFFLRTGFASDIQILEDDPVTYSSYLTRFLRWARGDWQNMPWIFNKVKDQSGKRSDNPLSVLARFKLLENILRTLLYPAVFTAFILALLGKPDLEAVSVLVLVVILLFELILSMADNLFNLRITLAWRDDIGDLLFRLKITVTQIAFRLVFISHLAVMSIITIVKTLYRMFISKKHLLQWQIFRRVDQKSSWAAFRASINSFIGLELLVLVIVVSKVFMNQPSFYMWLWAAVAALTPIWATVFSLQKTTSVMSKSLIDPEWFGMVALNTWRYFDDFVTKDTNYLPSDKWEPDSKHVVSRLTSATNIGLYITALDVASRSNYISTEQYFTRLNGLLVTMGRMKKVRGHFFNWYDINTLAVLNPKDVSTVDSGNLAASLITAEGSLRSFGDFRICSDSFWDTIRAAVYLAYGALDDGLNVRGQDLLQNINDVSSRFKNGQSVADFYQGLGIIRLDILNDAASLSGESAYWRAKLLDILQNKLQELEGFYPWVKKGNFRKWSDLDAALTLNELRAGVQIRLAGKLSNYNKKILLSSLVMIDKHIRLSQETSSACRRLYEAMDFSYLYDRQQKLFHISYSASKNQLDPNHYDTFASETRIASFIAIATGQVPIDHWRALSRPLAAYRGRLVMMSWSGSLFEYLFSQIFLANIKGSFLLKIYRQAVRMQIDYSNQLGIPWGISECCSMQKNESGDHVYAPHGVPLLGLKPNVKNSLVVSPYSSAMALEIEPKKAYDNLRRLRRDGAYGKYGFYEAVDYNDRLGGEIKGRPVEVVFVHHQAIILLSIFNYLNGGLIRDVFNCNLAIESTSFILSEKGAAQSVVQSVKTIALGSERI